MKRIVLHRREIVGVDISYETFLLPICGWVDQEECDVIVLGFNRFSIIVFNFEIGFYIGQDYEQ